MQNRIEYLTLNELNTKIKQAISSNLESTYWIVAEISDLKSNYSGHCYIELIQKDVDKDVILAKNRATIWASAYRMIKPYFETSTNQKFQAGITILVKVSVDFHPVYGLNINIKDIDPVYTLGDQQRRKIAILNQLESEGIIGMNMKLILPDIIQSIAIISSDSAAGYGDFIDQIMNNTNQYTYHIDLYKATMQGETASKSIIGQLETIYRSDKQYDAVVLIRGGGSVSDLMCFDTYELAGTIALFPIPVITGIGHERDQTIADMVAHTNLKTPTAVAQFIIEKSTAFELKLNNYTQLFQKSLLRYIEKEKQRIQSFQTHLPVTLSGSLENQNHILESLKTNLKYCIKSKTQLEIAVLNKKKQELDSRVEYGINHQKNKLKIAQSTIKNNLVKLSENHTRNYNQMQWILKTKINSVLLKENHKLELLEENIKSKNPIEQLKNGYSLTYHNGKRVKSIHDVQTGDIILTKIMDGTIVSNTTNIEQNK